MLTALGRAIRLHCPRCGSGGLFRWWVVMVPDCPTCGLHFERTEGYWLGSVAINILVTEALFVTVLVTWLVASWPGVPWNRVLAVTIAMNAVFPVAFHPFSRTLWIAGERHFYVRAHPEEDA
jgi:uncharacterized protein (DUF983 family)